MKYQPAIWITNPYGNIVFGTKSGQKAKNNDFIKKYNLQFLFWQCIIVMFHFNIRLLDWHWRFQTWKQ